MKLKILPILIAVIAYGQYAVGQTILADEENESSILNIPNSVGFDVTDEKITFNLNNIYSQRSSQTKWLFGTQYIGGNENKESRLFNKGKFVFGNEISGFVAYSWLKKSQELVDAEVERNKLRNHYNGIIAKHMTPLVALIYGQYGKLGGALNLNPNDSKALEIVLFGDNYPVTAQNVNLLKILDNSRRNLNPAKSELTNTEYRKILEGIGFSTAQINQVRDIFLIPILKYYETNNIEIAMSALYTFKTSQLSTAEDKVENIGKTRGIDRSYFYVKGGLNGVQFTGVESINDSSFFLDKEFRGHFVEFGYNILMKGKRYFGASLQFDYTSNFNDLSQSNYSFSRTDSIGGTAYQTKVEKTAYTGTFFKYHRQILKVDYAVRYPFKDKSTLIQGPYFRAIFQEDEELDLENDIRVGWGLNFHKNDGNSIFGIYLEIPQVHVGENDDGQGRLDRLTFGFRANYVFGGIVGL